MNKEKIKYEITELAKKHAIVKEDNVGDFHDAELIEIQAEDLIIAYCENKGYQINGFPTEKRKLNEEELDEDYFCRERFHLYLDTLTYKKEDVGELTWHFTDSFWPGGFESKDDFIAQAKDRVEDGGFYDIEI